MDHSIKAEELFLSGCNCAQAVVVAFCDLTGLDETTAKKLSSSFGGGSYYEISGCCSRGEQAAEGTRFPHGRWSFCGLLPFFLCGHRGRNSWFAESY